MTSRRSFITGLLALAGLGKVQSVAASPFSSEGFTVVEDHIGWKPAFYMFKRPNGEWIVRDFQGIGSDSWPVTTETTDQERVL